LQRVLKQPLHDETTYYSINEEENQYDFSSNNITLNKILQRDSRSRHSEISHEDDQSFLIVSQSTC
jgi:hypothetical protein